jgi:hypothetical protein
LIAPGPRGGRPAVTGAFLEALLDEHAARNRPSSLARKLMRSSSLVRRRERDLARGKFTPQSYDTVRSWVREAFKQPGEQRVRQIVISAVEEDILRSVRWSSTARAWEQHPDVPGYGPTFAEVPEMSYYSWVPTFSSEDR